jgi:tRNA dimethylallyltransferase
LCLHVSDEWISKLRIYYFCPDFFSIVSPIDVSYLKKLEKTVIVIQGPTAIGKSKLAVDLAKSLGTEIISADSRQVFKEMQIGTARPSESQLEGIPHHLLGHKSIRENYSAEDFAEETRDCLKKIYEDNDTAIVVGGSGFYIRALLYGMDDIPAVPERIRENVINDFEKSGIGFLQAELKDRDPDYFDKVDIHNTQRLIRALEVIRHTGRPFSSFHSGGVKKLPYRILNFALTMERQELYRRIEKRVDAMIEQGLEEEVRSLAEFKNLNALQTVGYNEFFSFFDGKISLEQCISDIKTNTRRFAKRQLTWLRRFEDIIWIDLDSQIDIIAFIKDHLK